MDVERFLYDFANIQSMAKSFLGVLKYKLNPFIKLMPIPASLTVNHKFSAIHWP